MESDSLPRDPSGEPETLEVGRVSKAHGIMGELRVTPHWESSDSLAHAERIWLALNGRGVAYDVERVRSVPRAYLVKLRGVDDRNTAEAVIGAQMADFGADAWPRMLCVESANVGASRITLGPGDSHTLCVAVSLASAG
jgi:ribosomal protein L35AE/L33A